MVNPSTVSGGPFNPPPGTNGFITLERPRWNFKTVNKIYLVRFSSQNRLLCSFCAFNLSTIYRPKFWQFKVACKFLKLETCGNGTFQSKVSLTKEIYWWRHVSFCWSQRKSVSSLHITHWSCKSGNEIINRHQLSFLLEIRLEEHLAV